MLPQVRRVVLKEIGQLYGHRIDGPCATATQALHHWLDVQAQPQVVVVGQVDVHVARDARDPGSPANARELDRLRAAVVVPHDLRPRRHPVGPHAAPARPAVQAGVEGQRSRQRGCASYPCGNRGSSDVRRAANLVAPALRGTGRPARTLHDRGDHGGRSCAVGAHVVPHAGSAPVHDAKVLAVVQIVRLVRCPVLVRYWLASGPTPLAFGVRVCQTDPEDIFSAEVLDKPRLLCGIVHRDEATAQAGCPRLSFAPRLDRDSSIR